jgi:tetratricopeptide (TPR) repeat protein
VDTYEQAIALHPGGFRARANLVEALRRLGRYEQARRELQVAKTIYPGHPKIRELGDRVERTAADGSP